MKGCGMTLEELRGELGRADSDAPLVFATGDGTIGPGYHVAEFRQADVTGIDCGGTLSTWSEAVMQLMDGHGRSHMPVGKFRSILSRSLGQVDGLGDARLRVEFAHGNAGLGLFAVDGVTANEDRATVTLAPEGAVCKPLMRAAAPVASACCGPKSAASVCCG